MTGKKIRRKGLSLIRVAKAKQTDKQNLYLKEKLSESIINFRNWRYTISQCTNWSRAQSKNHKKWSSKEKGKSYPKTKLSESLTNFFLYLSCIFKCMVKMESESMPFLKVSKDFKTKNLLSACARVNASSLWHPPKSWKNIFGSLRLRKMPNWKTIAFLSFLNFLESRITCFIRSSTISYWSLSRSTKIAINKNSRKSDKLQFRTKAKSLAHCILQWTSQRSLPKQYVNIKDEARLCYRERGTQLCQ